MANTKRKNPVIWFILLLTLGFAGLCLPNLAHLTWADGLSTAVWIVAFLCVTGRFYTKQKNLITGGVFLASYFLKYLGTMNFEWLYALLFLSFGLIQFCIFCGYSYLIRKWNRFYVTFAFPLLWMAVYLLAMLSRFPSLIRVDMMFADMNILLQSENLIGSFGLSFTLLWIFALFAYVSATGSLLRQRSAPRCMLPFC